MYSTFAPLLKQNGMPNHAIVDTGRNAVTGLRDECKYLNRDSFYGSFRDRSQTAH